MTDNKIGPNIRPIEPRTPDKSHRREQAPGTQDFDKALQQATRALDKLGQQPVATPAGGDAKAILDAAAAQKAAFESAMREADVLRQLHQNITQKPPQDKE